MVLVKVLVVFLLYPDIEVLVELLVAFGFIVLVHDLVEELLPERVHGLACTFLALASPLCILLALA